MRTGILGLAALGGLAARWAFMNRGLMPFYGPLFEIFEPKQRALIAWNGEEEMLVLSTDLRASEPTKVLEVMPLPAEPEVDEAPSGILERLWFTYQRKLAEHRGAGLTKGAMMRGRQLMSMDLSIPAGRLAHHETIGAHDISVVQVLRPEGFVEWVEGYLREAGVEQPDLSPEMEAIIGRYMARGYTWFVFDSVELGTTLRTNEPIMYRFASKRLYYPMEITSTGKGETEVELMVLTHEPLKYFLEMSHLRIRLDDRMVRLSMDDLHNGSTELAEMMGQPSVFRVWKIRGKLSSFREDVVATDGASGHKRALRTGALR